jgi:hypothetical protein
MPSRQRTTGPAAGEGLEERRYSLRPEQVERGGADLPDGVVLGEALDAGDESGDGALERELVHEPGGSSREGVVPAGLITGEEICDCQRCDLGAEGASLLDRVLSREGEAGAVLSG